MRTEMQSVNLAYTKQGNAYEKTSKGKKIGTAVGLGTQALYLGALQKLPMDKFFTEGTKDALSQVGYNTNNMKTYWGTVKEIINTTPQLGILDEAIYPKMAKIMKSKAGRIGIMAGGIATGFAIAALVGRGIGALCDKIKNNKAEKEADKAALQ